LAEPGGYLQWDDLDFQDDLDRVFPKSKEGAPSVREEGQMMFDFYKSQGWSLHLMDSITNALISKSVQDVRRTDYVQVAYLRPELGPELRRWLGEAGIAVMNPIYKRLGQARSDEEIKASNKDFIGRLEAMAANGIVFPMPMGTLVARKKDE
jgi:hypothetical protein